MNGGFTGYEVMEGDHGEVYQAGIPSRLATENDDGWKAGGWITRAVVLAVYYTDEDERNGWVKGKQKNILCDVRTIGAYSRPLFKVPVLQHIQGLWDEDIYIPRAAQQNISGGTFSTGSAAKDNVQPTPAEQMDGDHVLIGFLDNNPKLPVILPYTLGHSASNTAPKKADGRIRRIRHNGVVIEWDKDGNLTLDASKAAKPEFDGSGKEVSNSGTAGIITVKTKDGAGAQLQLKLDKTGNVVLEAGGATEALTLTKGALAELKAPKVHLKAALTELSDVSTDAVVMGTTFLAAQTTYLATQKACSAVNMTKFTLLSEACAGPLAPLKALFQDLATAWQTADQGIAALQQTLATWLSLKVKTG